MVKKGKSRKCELADRWGALELKLLPIDNIDIKILCVLLENARKSNTEIAEDLDLKEATVRRRIRNLVDKGIIQGFSIYLNYRLIENTVKAYIHVKVDSEAMEKVVNKVTKHKRVIALYRVTGEHDLLCVTLFVNMSELQDFIDNYLRIKGVKHVDTQIVMSAHKGVPWTGL
ncbi:MAG: Lrp/AsnC family transcriptional regulator [Thermoplasmata archaeon]|nr:MAG: Lrp/AsnC family transcriptional regulator [Thermoplasmata archaeon]